MPVRPPHPPLDVGPLLHTDPEERFDRLTRLATAAYDVPIAVIGLVDGENLWYKSEIGLGIEAEPLRDSFAATAIDTGMPDVLVDDLRFDNGATGTDRDQSRFGFYACIPLDDDAGRQVGAFAVADRRKRQLSSTQFAGLSEIADLVKVELGSKGLDRTTKELQQSTNLHRTVFDLLDEGIIVTDHNGVILTSNAAAERILGQKPRAGHRPRMHGLIRPDGTPLPVAERAVPTTIRTGEPVTGLDMGVADLDGNVRWVRVNTNPIRDPDTCELRGVVVAMSDTTERVEMQRIKDEFVSVVSHELRTPLTSVRGALRLLNVDADEPLSSPARQLVDIAESNTERLIHLVNDVLAIERMDQSPVSEEVEPTDLVALAHDTARLHRPLAAETGITIEVTTRAHDAVTIADPHRISQALTNLLGNAIKFSEPGTTVRIEVGRDATHAEVAVHDRGRGIPEANLESIFGRFQQVDKSDSRDRGGTGLGLAICKRIVEAHGGRIWAESVFGEGATLRFTLPLATETAAVPAG